MKSHELIEQLKKKGITRYNIYKITGISEQHMSGIKNEIRTFSITDLKKLIKHKYITKKIAMEIYWNDKSKEN